MAATSYYVTSDALGSVTGILDEEGNVIERRSYDAFGEMNCMTPDGTPTTIGLTGIDIAFIGQPRDEVIGAYQMGFRWYVSSLGRWTSRDIIGLRGGENLSRYVRNSPLNLTDIFGLCCDEPHKSTKPSKTTRKRRANWPQFFKGLSAAAAGTGAALLLGGAEVASGGAATPAVIIGAGSAAASISYGIGNMVAAFSDDEETAEVMEKSPSSVPQLIGRGLCGEEGQSAVETAESFLDIKEAIKSKSKLEKTKTLLEVVDKIANDEENADSTSGMHNPTPGTK
jgi:RHS repeat-associated protein